MSTPALNPLVGKIRQQYPGAYDDIDDATLTKRILAKYPQYEDLAAPGAQPQVGKDFGNVPRPPNPIDDAPVASPVAGMPGAAPYTPSNDTYEKTVAGLTGAAALGMGGRVALPAALELARRHPIATQMAASEAIGAARKIPVVGKFIPPGGELLPFILGEGFGGKGKTFEPEPATEPLGPETPSPELLQGNALSKLPPTGARPASQTGEALASIGKREFTPEPATPLSKAEVSKKLDFQLNDALGGKELQPNVPLRKQFESKPSIPEGHTAIEDSSAVGSYRYDPNAQEFHVTMKNNPGTTYVYRDVSPEQLQEFADAKSKGTAFQKIKSASAPPDKIIGGKRIPANVPRNLRSASPESEGGASFRPGYGGDLTPALQESLRKAMAAKK